jgi:hypothetical protein
MRGARPAGALVGTRALVAAVALAACGRLGFQLGAGPDGGDGEGDAIKVIVTSDEYLAEPAGQPIAGATVLIERGGVVERMVTDDAGTALFAAAGVTAYHVVYEADLGWRVYTAAAPRPGTFELGGRPALDRGHQMTLLVPGGAAADSYAVGLPDRCATVMPSQEPTFTFNYNRACSGTAVPVIAFRLPPSTPEYFDAGLVMLANGSTHVVNGSYQTAVLRTVEVTGLPAGTEVVHADVVARSGDDVMRVTSLSSSVATLGLSAATVNNFAARGGDALHVRAFLDLPEPSLSSSERIEPTTIADITQFDAARMLPPFTQVTAESLASVSWTGGGSGGTLIAVEATASMLQWNAYTEPSATSVTFPMLPADLGVPLPPRFALVTVAKLDIPGAAAADIARTLDRTWNLWPNSAALVPPAGGGMARMLYLPDP